MKERHAKQLNVTRLSLPALALLTCLMAEAAQAGAGQSISLAWNPSTNLDVVNYNVYYGVASGVYTNLMVVGDTTKATITGLVPGAHYYFAVEAEDSSGFESALSNETNCVAPLSTCNLTLSNLNQMYSGQPAVVSVSTGPANVAVTVTYNGKPSAPVNAGSYTVIATANSAAFTGAATNTLTISPAPATISLTHLLQMCDGAGEAVSVATQPAGLPTVVTYNGATNLPTNAGSYAVACSIACVNYTGFAANTLIISEADNARPSHFGIVKMNDGSLQLSFDGMPGGTYQVQYTESLSPPNWRPLAKQTADNSGLFQFADWPMTNAQGRFYRAVWSGP